MKKRLLIAALIGLTGMTWFALTAIRNERDKKRPPAAAVSPLAARSSASPINPRDSVSKKADGAFTADYFTRLKKEIQNGDPLDWEPTMGEMLKPWFPREDAVRILSDLLTNGDWMVRVRAAQFLLEFGVDDGIAVLSAAIEAGRSGGDISLLAVATAANVLHTWRLPADGSNLFACFQRFKDPVLLLYAGLRQAPEIPDYVRQQRAANLSSNETEYVGVICGMNDAESIQHYQLLTGERAGPEIQLLGHWALFRATGNPADLDFVIATLREGVGLDPVSERSQPWTGTKERAFDYLQVLQDSRVTTAFEAIADHSAKSPAGTGADFTRAFGAIAYFGWDDSFIDSRLVAFFEGRYVGPGIDRGLMWKVASARNTPAVIDAAKAANPELAQQYLSDDPKKNSKINWFGLLRVPIGANPTSTKAVRPPE